LLDCPLYGGQSSNLGKENAGIMGTVLRLENISKTFGSYTALKSVSIDIETGEIHGLVGENGSGKSTLLNILIGNPVIMESGGYKGNIYLEGKKIGIRSPRQAIAAGFGMVHQEFALLPGFTTGQNIKLGREKLIPVTRKLFGKNLALIDTKKDHMDAHKALKQLGINLDPRIRTANLPVNLRQFIELAREISRDDLKVLVLDEPTAALGAEETKRLMTVLHEIAGRGTAIIFVSHKLEEVIANSDRITVLRDGEVAASLERDDERSKLDSIALLMVGKKTAEIKNRSSKKQGQVVLKIENLTVDMPGEPIKNFNLDIRQGEILGIAGLSGHGKMALSYGLMGMFPSSGKVSFNGSRINTADSVSMISKGIFFLPDDRREAGLLLERSIVENIVFTAVQKKGKFIKYKLGPLSTIDWRKAVNYAVESIKIFDIRCKSVFQPVGLLSGGNQQKICLARAMAFEPEILFTAEPTRGIDIGAKRTVLESLVRMNRESGTGIVCISSELSDLKQICNRILVVFEGEIFGEYSPQTGDNEFALAFSGKRPIQVG
jgi:simple sugar transport system ATP-binding protein